jgi:outer membrane murein-binding lipoprotein Lpp
MKHFQFLIAAASAALLVAGCASYGSAKPSRTIEQVMEQGFKGKESLNARISKGEGNADDFKLMASLVHDLAHNKPPMGDLASWTAKTAALESAAGMLVAGQPGALDAFKAAANCKACHSAHKPD